MTSYIMKDGLPIDSLTDDEMAAFLKGRPLIAEAASDRRSSPRSQFRCLRLAADLPEGGCASGNFYPVRCQDLSSRGIGFFAPKQPGSRSLVVQLSADGESPVLIEGKVVYCNDKSGDPAFPFVVGCMFTKRL
jgi:hypothetical protein